MKLIENVQDYNKIQEAIAMAINSSTVSEGLQDLGYEVDHGDTVDWNQFGVIEVSGGENETSFIVELRVEKIQLGFNTLIVANEQAEAALKAAANKARLELADLIEGDRVRFRTPIDVISYLRKA